MTTLTNLELQKDWLTASNLGNTTPGSGATANYGVTQGAAFYISSPGPFGNGYNYRVIPVDDTVKNATKFHYEFECLLHSPQNTYPQAIEFEFERHITGHVYNFALQLDFAGSKTFRHFDYKLPQGSWISTGIPCPFLTPDTWHKLALEGHLVVDQDDGTLHNIVDGFALDGTVFTTGMLFNGVQLPNSTEDKFTHALQLDTNGSNPPPPFELWVRNMSLSWQ